MTELRRKLKIVELKYRETIYFVQTAVQTKYLWSTVEKQKDGIPGILGYLLLDNRSPIRDAHEH